VRHLFRFPPIAITIIMTTSNPKILEAFLVQKLTTIATSTEPPTYTTLYKAQLELNSNATAIYSYAGDGAHGHLALTISAADYMLTSAGNVPFIPPINPGPAPVHLPNATRSEISETNRQFKEDQATFKLYRDADSALRGQVIEATHDFYIRALKNKRTGYGSLTCLEILTHLWTTYGRIKKEELEINIERMKQPWNPPTPIESLFTQLEDGMVFAEEGKEPILESSVIRWGATIFQESNAFPEECKAWRKIVDDGAVAQTMDDFKKHFRAAEKDRRYLLTAGSAGFHKANAAKGTKAPGGGGPPAPDTNGAAIAPAESSYCWTHGCIKNKKHTSSTCNNKAEGHIDEATLKNKQGGSTKIWGPRS
jgi:hypothetical protein